MLVDQHLIRLCEAILNNSINNEEFDNLVVETGVILEKDEWDVPNRLLNKKAEISHAAGGPDRKIVH